MLPMRCVYYTSCIVNSTKYSCLQIQNYIYFKLYLSSIDRDVIYKLCENIMLWCHNVFVLIQTGIFFVIFSLEISDLIIGMDNNF